MLQSEVNDDLNQNFNLNIWLIGTKWSLIVAKAEVMVIGTEEFDYLTRIRIESPLLYEFWDKEERLAIPKPGTNYSIWRGQL